MSTVKQQSIVNTIEQLHKDSSVNTGTIPLVEGGLYNLINNMISNLSYIKASIKTEEKKMIHDLGTVTTNSGTINGDNFIIIPTVVAASLASDSNAIRGDVHTGTATIDNNVAVYSGSVTTATAYSESAAWEILRDAAQTIVDFKEGSTTGSGSSVNLTNSNTSLILQEDTA
tara:strand:- start:7642 stop:8157 length:516 start_codon:yes stop_codon:yes gene_type:complete